MIRIIAQRDDAGMAASVGGNVLTSFKTFDVEVPEIEAWLCYEPNGYSHAQVIGIEVISVPERKTP